MVLFVPLTTLRVVLGEPSGATTYWIRTTSPEEPFVDRTTAPSRGPAYRARLRRRRRDHLCRHPRRRRGKPLDRDDDRAARVRDRRDQQGGARDAVRTIEGIVLALAG